MQYQNQLLAVYSESNNGKTFITVHKNKSEKEIVMDFMDWIATCSHEFYASSQHTKIQEEIISALRFENQDAPKATTISNIKVWSDASSPTFRSPRMTVSYTRPLDLRTQEYSNKRETPVLKLAIYVPSSIPLAADREYTLILTSVGEFSDILK